MMKYLNSKRFIFPFFRSSKFQHPKGFSFLELLIVMMIVSILFVTFRSSFQVKNQDVLYGQSCVESIYWEVNNFLYAAISSKSINSWWTQIFPDIYTISFDPNNQKIALTYKTTEDIYYTYNTIIVSGQNNMQYCDSKYSTLLLSGDTYEITINKWLQKNNTMKSFYLSGVSITGENIFLWCDGQGNGCKNISYFLTDTRTIAIQKYMCLRFSTTGDCLEWDN